MQEGTPDDLYQTPKNTLVAEFVGTPKINFVDCVLSSKEGTPFFARGGIALPSPKELVHRLDRKGQYTIGIRPGDFELTDVDDAQALHGFVELIEPLGDDILVHFRIEEGIYVAKLDAASKEQINEKITLKVNPGNLHVFDAASRERLG